MLVAYAKAVLRRLSSRRSRQSDYIPSHALVTYSSEREKSDDTLIARPRPTLKPALQTESRGPSPRASTIDCTESRSSNGRDVVHTPVEQFVTMARRSPRAPASLASTSLHEGGDIRACDMHPDPVVASFAASLQSPDSFEKEKALEHLAKLLNDSYDDDANALCASLRDAGVIEELCQLLEHPGPSAKTAMFIVGNVSSEARDSTD